MSPPISQAASWGALFLSPWSVWEADWSVLSPSLCVCCVGWVCRLQVLTGQAWYVDHQYCGIAVGGARTTS